MEITIQRPPIQDLDYTISTLSVDGTFFSDCLEDRDRNLHASNPDEIKLKKIKHETAIPYGKYEVIMSFSDRFQKYLPLLIEVPHYDGVRIHSGNKKDDTSGCILPGSRSKDSVINSRIATTKLISLIAKKLKTEKV